VKELFPVSQTKMLSPRLKWMATHGVESSPVKTSVPAEKWCAYLAGKRTKTKSVFGTGPTEEEACRDLGVKLGIRLWNEVP
jgi:hypothetical protein